MYDPIFKLYKLWHRNAGDHRVNAFRPAMPLAQSAHKPWIVSSEETNLEVIRNLVSKLDIRRAQVLVEAIIVELSETAAKSLGVETIFAGAFIFFAGLFNL